MPRERIAVRTDNRRRRTILHQAVEMLGEHEVPVVAQPWAMLVAMRKVATSPRAVGEVHLIPNEMARPRFRREEMVPVVEIGPIDVRPHHRIEAAKQLR